MPCYYCYQSLCICCLEVLFGVGQVGLRMCWEGKLPNYGIALTFGFLAGLIPTPFPQRFPAKSLCRKHMRPAG